MIVATAPFNFCSCPDIKIVDNGTVYQTETVVKCFNGIYEAVDTPRTNISVYFDKSKRDMMLKFIEDLKALNYKIVLDYGIGSRYVKVSNTSFSIKNENADTFYFEMQLEHLIYRSKPTDTLIPDSVLPPFDNTNCGTIAKEDLGSNVDTFLVDLQKKYKLNRDSDGYVIIPLGANITERIYGDHYSLGKIEIEAKEIVGTPSIYKGIVENYSGSVTLTNGATTIVKENNISYYYLRVLATQSVKIKSIKVKDI